MAADRGIEPLFTDLESVVLAARRISRRLQVLFLYRAYCTPILHLVKFKITLLLYISRCFVEVYWYGFSSSSIDCFEYTRVSDSLHIIAPKQAFLEHIEKA